MSEPYPRDMIGYGAEPPQANWPGEARLALQFVINYEEGAENAIFHGRSRGGSLPVGMDRRPADLGAA